MFKRNPLEILAGALTLLLPLLVYGLTLAPTLNFWDAGEFITAGYTLGIPHPPATPMYVLVARLASLLPLGESVAHRINFMSAIFASLASLMMYLLVLKVTGAWREEGKAPLRWMRVAGGMTAAFFIAFSDTFWINAIEAEVYSLSAFLMGFTLWLILDWGEVADKRRGNALIYLILYLLSLAVGFHLGTILVFPGFFVLALMIRKKGFSDIELWLVGAALALFLGSTILHMPDSIMVVGLLLILAAGVYLAAPESMGGKGRRPFVLYSLGLFALGLSVHLFLYIRAGQQPMINEADPSTWKNLWAVLKREQYPFQLPTERKAALAWQFKHFFGYLGAQFRMPGESSLDLSALRFHTGRALTALPLGLGILGMTIQWFRERKHWAALFTVLFINTIGLVFFLNFSDSEVRERDYFYANGFYYYALFIGIGAVGLLDSLRRERGRLLWSALLAPLLIIASLAPIKQHYFTHDRSENVIARDYAYNMLAPLAKNAVIFTNGDNDTFPLWYIQEVEGFRKDVRVVNLSLLNTDWYMRQLRDVEPVLPLSWDDAMCTEVMSHYYRLEDGRIVQPRDEVINHLFVNSQRQGWETTPFYFAVTIPRDTLLPFMPYLVMEGMVYRMTLTEGNDQVDVEKLRYNLEHRFEWQGVLGRDRNTVGEAWSERREGRSILEITPAPDDPALDMPTFYKDPTITHLIQNYAAAWSRLAIELDRAGPGRSPDPEGAVRAMEMASLIREDLGPVVLYLGYLYMKNGQHERAMRTYEQFLEHDPDNWQLWARYAQAAESAEDHQRVVQALGEVIRLNPDYEPAYFSLVDYVVSYFPSQANLTAIRDQVAAYLERHPESEGLVERLRLIEEVLAGGSVIESGQETP
jgi:hypothetical protein